MYVNDFKTSEKVRLNQVLHTLKSVHGVDIRVDLGSENAERDLLECHRSYEEVRRRIIGESQFNSYQQNPEYIKSMLILEAVRMMLKEIAPKRRRKGSSSVSESAKTEDLQIDQPVPGEMTAPEEAPPSMDAVAPVVGKAHHYEYQASMARGELYRNSKYAMSMLKQISPDSEIQPWIASSLTKSAAILDKVYHYLDYYKKFEPEKLPEDHDGDAELGETSGSVARQNLMMIMEYSVKLFEMIKPGDKLEGWVAMKLTTASECISSCKHYMDYVQFERHAMDDHFTEAKRAKRRTVAESADPLAKAAASMVGPRGADRRDYSDKEWETLKRVASGKYTGADRSLASQLISQSRRPERKLPESLNEAEDLAKASTILAAKDIAGQVQEMAEDLAKLSVEELMPLVDIMRGQFGPEAADGFNGTVKAALDELLDLTTKTKEIVASAVDTLNSGGIPEAETDIEKAGEEPEATEPSSADSDIEKDLASLGGEEEPAVGADTGPLGRGKKEEVTEASKKAAGSKTHGAKDMKTAKTAASHKKPPVSEASKTRPDYPDLDGDGNRKEPIAKAAKDAKDAKKKKHELEEKAPPGKKAEDFIKGNKESFKKRYGKRWQEVLYATAWKKFGKKTEAYDAHRKSLDEARAELARLEQDMTNHRSKFKAQLAEGKVSDPLNMGYGLEGDAILERMSVINKRVASIKHEMKRIMTEGVVGMLKGIQVLNTVENLERMKSVTPYGVIYTSPSGKKSRKMFESADARAYWLELKGDTIGSARLINPETFDAAIDRKKGN